MQDPTSRSSAPSPRWERVREAWNRKKKELCVRLSFPHLQVVGSAAYRAVADRGLRLRAAVQSLLSRWPDVRARAVGFVRSLPETGREAYAHLVCVRTREAVLRLRALPRKVKYVAAAGIAAFALAGGTWAFVRSQTVELVRVYVDGEPLGYASSASVVQDYLVHRLERIGHATGGRAFTVSPIALERVRVFRGSAEDDAVLERLGDRLNVRVHAYALRVNGQHIAYLASEEEARTLLSDALSKLGGTKLVYTGEPSVHVVPLAAPAEGNPSESGKTIQIKETVEVVPAVVPPEELAEPSAVETLLLSGSEPELYQIQPGDTLWAVAQKFGITVDDLVRLNPGLSANDVLYPGQQINVGRPKALLTVREESTQTVEVDIPYGTKEVKDDSLPAGKRVVKVKGQPGKKRLVYRVVMENGLLKEQEVLREEVLVPPVDEVVAIGTRVAYSVAPQGGYPVYEGTGNFVWPTKGGYVASPFGPRWGGFHTGIDISGVQDRTIVAADRGTVVYAAWMSGYGNLVIVDHGNGYSTYYAHLAQILVSAGQRVEQGQKIGIMGMTGNATGIHLHFEIRKNGTPTNPLSYYRAR
ncbi:MAG: peptidoglycan DD-metalloendopeptidase family protein [Brockia lithotrophica]|nr:peptidoglycan DD-metalloendopeptidase family protein [Brockia lithotrophica]